MIKSHNEMQNREITITDAIVCDLCKKEFKGDEWTDDTYHHIETKVSYNDYESFPDDYYTNEEISMDICPECFKHKLIPWILKQGGQDE
jgi:hypothetical protein